MADFILHLEHDINWHDGNLGVHVLYFVGDTDISTTSSVASDNIPDRLFIAKRIPSVASPYLILAAPGTAALVPFPAAAAGITVVDPVLP